MKPRWWLQSNICSVHTYIGKMTHMAIWLYVLDGLKPRRRWRLCTVVVNSMPMNARMAAIHCGSCHLPCRPSQPRWRPRQWPQQWLQPRQLPPCRLLRCRFRCGSTWHIKVMTKFTTYLNFWRFNVMFDLKMLHRRNFLQLHNLQCMHRMHLLK